jgi:hypothetical protein
MRRDSVTPFEQNQFLEHAHRNLDIDRSQEILFAGANIGDLAFLPLYRSCMERTGTKVGGWKVFRRAKRALILARYFDHALTVPGGRVECGVFRGFSALMLSLVARMRDQGFDGTGFHLIDSFEGLSTPTADDAIGIERFPNGHERPVFPHLAGHFATPIGHVRSVMADFPGTAIHKGWIPEVLSDLPDTDWSFVHIDVDLFEPTKACLEYFLPRLAPGGVIVNDDFGSPLFPGGGRSWQAVMEDRGLSYAVLDTGQAVYVNQPSID